MATIFEYPKKAEFGRIIPKNKIYEHSGASSSLKNLFVRQVDRIIWKYVIASDTVNIVATKSIQEIDIIEISLKEEDLKFEILQAIDKSLPNPTFFELTFKDKIKIVAAYKRKSEVDKSKWVISDYFESNWLPQNQEKQPLPTSLDLSKLYEELLKPLLPHKPRDRENIKDQVARIGLIFAKEKESAKLEARLAKEKQFNFQVEINAKIRILIQEIDKLKTI
jgi:hypothetical protein